MQDKELSNLMSELKDDIQDFGKDEAFLFEIKRIRTALERIADDISVYVDIKTR